MNGNSTTRYPPPAEESVSLLDEKSLSDIESDAGRAEIENYFSTRPQIWTSTVRGYAHGLRSAPWRSLALKTAIFFVPSFLQSRISRDPGLRTVSRRAGSTAYLDGMRGLAALVVFFCHYFYTCFIIAEGWGFGENNYHILKLPIIRLFYQGPPMVCIFFIVSGYALSLKPLKLARSRSQDAFTTTMSSFVFRRPFRLFLPTAASTLLIVVMIRLGLYEWTRDFAQDATYMRNVRETHYRHFDTTSAQLADWAWNLFGFIHVWGWEKFGGSMGIDVHLWTIPVEFRASMTLFLTLVGTARLRTGLRFFFVALVMWFTYRNDRWEMLLFFCGMVLAEWDLIRGAHNGPSSTNPVLPTADLSNSSLLRPVPIPSASPPPVSRASGRLKTIMWTSLSILALYLMSQPDIGFESTPGWVFLSSLIPEWFSDKYRYWQCVGAVLFVLAVGHSPAWQRFFNTAVVQYFGRISFSLYLMHGPVLHTFGYATERWMWSITGIEGAAYNWGFVLASVFVVPMVIWAADVFWRAVDTPTMRFAKWLEVKCSVSD